MRRRLTLLIATTLSLVLLAWPAAMGKYRGSDLLGNGGYREVLVNAEGRPAKLAEGVDPQLTTHQPQAGKDLRMTIDMDLQ